jgi:hypothetical protein
MTVVGCKRPDGSGRFCVRRIFASYSRSSNWFNAAAPAATSAVAASVLNISSKFIAPRQPT